MSADNGWQGARFRPRASIPLRPFAPGQRKRAPASGGGTLKTQPWRSGLEAAVVSVWRCLHLRPAVPKAPRALEVQRGEAEMGLGGRHGAGAKRHVELRCRALRMKLNLVLCRHLPTPKSPM